MVGARTGIAAVGAAACLLVFAAVAFSGNSSSEVELAEAAALVQTGKGLSLGVGKWDVAASKPDARLADQIAGWTKHKEASLKFVPATHTEKLADTTLMAQPSLMQQMHASADSLRLSDFLSGVNPETTQAQVQSLYKQMDPKDTTGWKEREVSLSSKTSRFQQVNQIKHFQHMLQNQLSTTPNLDSAKAKKDRTELEELLQKREALKKRIQHAEETEIHTAKGNIWTPRAKKLADQDDDLLKKLSRTEDSRSTYQKWLKEASGNHEQSGKHAIKKPIISAGGQLKWKPNTNDAHLKSAQARLQTLAENAKRSRRSRSNSHGVHGAKNLDLIESAEAEDEPSNNWQSIQQRAAYKVNRWMGGGYTQVYDKTFLEADSS